MYLCVCVCVCYIQIYIQISGCICQFTLLDFLIIPDRLLCLPDGNIVGLTQVKFLKI